MPPSRTSSLWPPVHSIGIGPTPGPAHSTGHRVARPPAPKWLCSTPRAGLGLNEPFINESILGTLFTGELVEQTTVGEYPAVIPTIAGQAWITGRAEYVLDPTDPFPEGYTLGDIWA